MHVEDDIEVSKVCSGLRVYTCMLAEYLIIFYCVTDQ